ncbi:MAG TPA: ATP-dependent 6-phosphofructokinase [Solirubrobacteraceae bacterium]|nr:ATP-dependent 6-phosphofructokinase [Solirubrobacteraceae bacterium]
MARIGLLTGGGDCPGLNPVIRGIVRKGIDHYGHEIFGFRKGWKGVIENDAIELTRENTSGILHKGGTILGTSRTNVYKTENGEERVLASLKARGIDVLIPIGGDDTLGVARKLWAAGFPTVGVPKTIDNDLNATDFTFGFQTAVQICTEAIDRLHSTAESHDRVIVCEVMGRDAGWIAAWCGLAGGADVILVPERPYDLDEVCNHITHRHTTTGKTFSIVVVAEGATPAAGGEAATAADTVDSFGHARLGGIAVQLEKQIEEKTGYECRATVLGHIQRGGSPVAFDRVLGSRFGVAAIDAASNGDFGKMVALHGTDIELVALEDALDEPKLLDDAFFETAQVFFG